MISTDIFAQFIDSAPRLTAVFIKTAEGRCVSYSDMVAQSARYAHVLRRAGVRPGDRVAARIDKSPEAILLYLACLRAGAVYLPLNTAYTLPELEYFLGDAQPGLTVCDPVVEPGIAPLMQRLGLGATLTLGVDGDTGSLPAVARTQAPTFDDAPCSSDDLAAILYTSGTTGRSKGAMLTRGNLAANAQALKEAWRFTSADVLLHALPIFHTHGLFVATNVTLMAGGAMIFLPRFDADLVFRVLPEATTMMGVPTFYTRLLQDERLDRAATRHMRLFVSGSAPLLPETHAEWRDRTGHAILERYGMTETNMNASNPYDGPRVPGSVGLPLPGVEIRIAQSETGKLLPEGEIGMIEVRGPNVFPGYWRVPEKTRAEFRADNFFITGDLGRLDANGYLFIVGRGKDLVISGGYNIYPKELEDEIAAITGVEESAVIGVPHSDLGEAVAAVVTLRNGATLSETDILSALGGRLAKYKLPRRVIFVEALPRNTMGKVQKNLLREQFRDLCQR